MFDEQGRLIRPVNLSLVASDVELWTSLRVAFDLVGDDEVLRLVREVEMAVDRDLRRESSRFRFRMSQWDFVYPDLWRPYTFHARRLW